MPRNRRLWEGKKRSRRSVRFAIIPRCLAVNDARGRLGSSIVGVLLLFQLSSSRRKQKEKEKKKEEKRERESGWWWSVNSYGNEEHSARPGPARPKEVVYQ